MASKYAGYMGKVILIDLTTETVREYPWSDEQRELYLGGKIMAARILCDHLTGKETAFSEENWVVISTGPLTGTGAPSSARFNISALSPQTGIPASSNYGGSFGFHLKKAGYDALILKGKCQEHKWLEINEDQFIFHDTDDLWGMKVITVSGNKAVPVYDKEKTTAWCKKWFAYLQNHPLTGNQLPKVGTAGLVSSMQMRGLLSTRNYSAGQYEDFEQVSGERLAEEFNITNKPVRAS